MAARDLVRRTEDVEVRRAVAFFPRLEVERIFEVTVLLLFFAAAFLRLPVSSTRMGQSQPWVPPIPARLRIDPVPIRTTFRLDT